MAKTWDQHIVDKLARVEAERDKLRELLADAIEDETEFETEWNKAARAALGEIENGKT